MARRGRVAWAGVLIGGLLAGSVVFGRVAAYNDDGHFYTAISVARSRLPAFADKGQQSAVLMMLCAQVPDLAWEYDAVSLRVNITKSWQGWAWGGFSACRGTDVCHMVSVHHYVHALTDQDAEKTTAAAQATLDRLLDQGNAPDIADPNRVCAAGFAVHLLGDSFAHRRLRERTRMYPAGMGHFRDDHDPDYVLYDADRVEKYLVYARALDHAFRSKTGDERWTKLTDELAKLRGKASSTNKYNEVGLRDALLIGLGGEADARIWAPYKPTIDQQAKDGGLVLSRTCKEVLDAHAPPALKGVLNCNTVWKRFKDAAVPAFNAAGIKPTCPTDDAWSDGVSPPAR